MISSANSLQAFLSTQYAQNLYIGSAATNNESPANALSARTFGTWTFLSAVVRWYAAYNIRNPVVYDMALWTYGIACAHFLLELLVFKSAQLRGRFVAPLLVACGSITWMFGVRGYYLGL